MARRQLTQKQEAMCLKYIECGSQVEAYQAAYDASRMSRTTAKKRAHEAFQLPHVQARVAELRDQIGQRAALSKAWVLAELVKVYETAASDQGRNLAAANRALELIGTQLGMFVKRRVVARLEDLSEEELIEFLGGEPTRDEFEQALSTLSRTRPAGHA